ncbi:hypothetical protein [Streptomyces sp. NPDC086787]|uniref:hypothetical protein n=1 Tax=Streptomyces sp. NPDC086787 TaxID=3365759 RepID=UPI00380CF999
MSTGLIIALIVIAAVVVAAAVMLTLRARGGHGGRNLKQRFGPEYDRAVARHDGDTKAAERELAERVERYGGLRERPLEPAERERFEARWTAAQEHFVEEPRQAVSEADLLLMELAGARGFPDGGRYEEQVDALSVHHAAHLDGYRRVHSGTATADTAGGTDTEDLRMAMVEARAFFDDLVTAGAESGHRHRRSDGAPRNRGGSPLPLTSHRARPKES